MASGTEQFVKVLLVGAGGFIGAICRYLAATAVNSTLKAAWIPYGTLAVNVLGCFLIGLLEGIAQDRGILSPETRLLVVVGILGGFTTFSTFGLESYNLLRANQPAAAIGYIALHLVAGLGAVYLGMLAARLGQ